MDEMVPPAMFSELKHTGGETHLLREVMLTSQALLNVFSREVGMPPSRLAILRLFAVHHPATLGVMEIARLLGVNAAAVTRQVKEMVALDLVSQHDDAKDRRRVSLQLTDTGRAVFEEVHLRAHQFEAALLQDVRAEDTEAAANVLAALRAAAERLR